MIAAALVCAALGQAQSDPNKVIATVNGENITASEYYHHMEFMQGVTMNFGGQNVESTPGFFAIAQLIGQRLTYQLAKEKGVLPSKQEVDDELQSRLSRDPKYIEEMADAGITQTDLLDSIKFDLAKFKLQTAGITVTDQEVKQFYAKNPAEYTTGKMVKCRIIAVKTDADEAPVDSDLQSGKDFSAVAKDKSVDVTRSLGGDIGTVFITFFPQNVQQALNAIKIGNTTDWLDVNGAKVKYQLADVVPPKLQPLDKFTTMMTRRQLMIQKGMSQDDLAKEINDMKAKSKVTISQKQFADLWQQLNGQSSGG
jgi:hypothetical protein